MGWPRQAECGNLQMSTARKSDVRPEVAREIEKALRTALLNYGFQGADINPGLDHDGDPVLFIDVRYRRSDAPVTADALIRAMRAVRRKLDDFGEERFPHIRHHFDDQQKVADHR